MTAAIVFSGNTASTFLTHFFGTSLADEHCVVERFMALADEDIRHVAGEATAKRKSGRRGGKRATFTRNDVKEMRPVRNEIILCTGRRIKGGIQLWGDVATLMFRDRRQKGSAAPLGDVPPPPGSLGILRLKSNAGREIFHGRSGGNRGLAGA